MVSFLYGARFNCQEIFKWAAEKNLFIFQDQAQSFNGLERNGKIYIYMTKLIYLIIFIKGD